jgi:hypothetical protein
MSRDCDDGEDGDDDQQLDQREAAPLVSPTRQRGRRAARRGVAALAGASG